jgi:hypothetical protein
MSETSTPMTQAASQAIADWFVHHTQNSTDPERCGSSLKAMNRDSEN